MGGLQYLIGVDGGGTGTRICISGLDGVELVRAEAGASALQQGIDKAWANILQAVRDGFSAIGVNSPDFSLCAVGLGMSGVHNRTWAAEFEASNPGFAKIIVETDGFSTLLGAHNGAHGAVIAVGTGSIGEGWLPDGQRVEVGGWGFPTSDEGSGAYLGLKAINHVQRLFDGRQPMTDFGRALLAVVGDTKEKIFDWMGKMKQGECASLSPIVVQYGEKDAVARGFLLDAGREIKIIGAALRTTAPDLPIALCGGGLSEAMRPYIPAAFLATTSRPQKDSCAGALILIHKAVSA
ncbi:BadF/BadG/BcrA/BcrD ATPase family protein [Silvimonas sp.]|uniref:BadF/BadG/BcrA/BcrD ATPase family protein n=1 Tax=Silvimonas sp. TaxID=2650811 RepID=UPI00284357AC|nr:BadF/BadG/BcrA/BcrD ATPase family protein [Silvimonas sp.]MDR3426863.1 BadF/BadG/BcrA/BcrD ATPase family protein [Silvimonas sp.]